MQDEICVAVEQAFQGAAHGFEMQVQAGAGAIGEEAGEQAENLGAWAQVTYDQVQLGFLAQGQVCGVATQAFQLTQQHLGAAVEGAAGIGQAHPVAATV
ncbi:hypothetical protein D3C76_1161610 [compost metagenome]